MRAHPAQNLAATRFYLSITNLTPQITNAAVKFRTSSHVATRPHHLQRVRLLLEEALKSVELAEAAVAKFPAIEDDVA